ncbi:MAG: thiol-disulfide oxidoreductase DCC family protein [Salibacteraceae bacterium]
MIQNQDQLILFDGVCNLCNGFVQFIIRHDQKKQFKFATLQSQSGQALLSEFGKSSENFDSVVFVVNRKLKTKSTAVLHIAKEMGGIWSFAVVFIIIPRIMRDWVYDIIARNRYSFFGKRQECMVPTKDVMERFV